jgi:hypothetical protein
MMIELAMIKHGVDQVANKDSNQPSESGFPIFLVVACW